MKKFFKVAYLLLTLFAGVMILLVLWSKKDPCDLYKKLFFTDLVLVVVILIFHAMLTKDYE